MSRLSELFREAMKTDGSPEAVRALIKGIYYSQALAEELFDRIKLPPRNKKAKKALAALVTRYYASLRRDLGDRLDLSGLDYFGIGTRRSHVGLLENLMLGNSAFHNSVAVRIRHSNLGEDAFHYSRRPEATECFFRDGAFKYAENPQATDCKFGYDAFLGAKNPLVINCEMGYGAFARTRGKARVYARTCRSLTEPGPGVYIFWLLEEAPYIDTRHAKVLYVDGDGKELDGAVRIKLEDLDHNWTPETFDRNARRILRKYGIPVPGWLRQFEP